MKLIDSTFFSHWNIIPNLNEPEPHNRTSEDLDVIVDYAVKDVLSNAFDIAMYRDFEPYIIEGGFSEDAPQVYKDIVFGKDYTKTVNGKDTSCSWAGLVESNPKCSLIADISYYLFKTQSATLSTEFGEAIVNTKLGNTSTIAPKVTSAYNSFVRKFNGGVRSNASGFTMEGNPFWVINGGVDYYGIYDYSGQVSLMKFLYDNREDYPLFNADIRRIGMPIKNEFGL